MVGFLPTYALHLLADMFPKAWRGSALINTYPLAWTMPGWLSFGFLGVGVYSSIKIFMMIGGVYGSCLGSSFSVWWAAVFSFFGGVAG